MDRREARAYSNSRPSSRPQGGRRPASGAYDGRFGSSADAGRKRPTGSYRSQPSGSYRSRMGYEEGARRPSVRGSSDSYTRRPEPKAPPKPAKKKSGKRVNPLMLVLVILALLVLAALIVLVVTSMGQTYHQLPTVQRL